MCLQNYLPKSLPWILPSVQPAIHVSLPKEPSCHSPSQRPYYGTTHQPPKSSTSNKLFPTLPCLAPERHLSSISRFHDTDFGPLSPLHPKSPSNWFHNITQQLIPQPTTFMIHSAVELNLITGTAPADSHSLNHCQCLFSILPQSPPPLICSNLLSWQPQIPLQKITTVSKRTENMIFSYLQLPLHH